MNKCQQLYLCTIQDQNGVMEREAFATHELGNKWVADWVRAYYPGIPGTDLEVIHDYFYSGEGKEDLITEWVNFHIS